MASMLLAAAAPAAVVLTLTAVVLIRLYVILDLRPSSSPIARRYKPSIGIAAPASSTSWISSGTSAPQAADTAALSPSSPRLLPE